jgi:carbon storage regulator
MLVLARSRNEALRIGEEIEISVLEISGSAVRLGICAPANIRVLRSELTVQIADVGSELSGRSKTTSGPDRTR